MESSSDNPGRSAEHDGVLIIALVAEGHAGYLLALDLAAGIGAVGCQDGRPAVTSTVASRRPAQLQIDAYRGVGIQYNPVRAILRETGLLYVNTIGAGGEISEREEPTFVCGFREA